MATAELTDRPPASERTSLARDSWRAWLRAYALLWAFTLGSCLLILAVPGGPSLARGVLQLTLTAEHNPPPSLAGVLSIAANNTLRSVWPLALGLIDAQQQRATRLLADGAVLANLLVSGVLVAGALGGYGVRMLAFLPHLPLEWAGLAAGAAAWAVERERRLARNERLFTALLIVSAILCSAIFETCATPHR